jgi:group I intron endonuclease
MYGIIYSIENKINNRYYIGQTTRNLHERKLEHLRDNRYPIDRAIQKYGNENFEWKVIDEANDQDVLNMLERLHISRYESLTTQWGYNLESGGSNGKLAESTKEKIRQANIGKKYLEETKQKVREASTGRLHSLKNKLKMSDFKCGKFPGTHFNKTNGKWQTRIRFNGFRKHLIYSDDPISGSIVYEFVKNEIYGGENNE